ncbi:DNA/RNA nuclease SfsA [Enterococcus sp. LJL120]
MEYQNIYLARFVRRVNRFIAECLLEDELVIVHVKNTGRGTELLIADALVAISYQDSPARKTKYDLIAVKKADFWINIDSQLPNKLVAEGLKNGQIHLPQLTGKINLIKPEVKHLHSKFDFYGETAAGEKFFIEVKGVTLENFNVAAFPDAPTLRGLKHVSELTAVLAEGYLSYVIFVVEFQPVKVATIHTAMQPALRDAFAEAIEAGVQVLAYNCQVSPNQVTLKEAIPFDLDFSFIDPN